MAEAGAAVPGGVPEVGGLAEPCEEGAACAAAQVGGGDSAGARVVRCLRVLPFGAAVQPLKGVVVEARAEGEAVREGAVAKKGGGVRARDLVDVGDDEYVVGADGLGPREKGDDLVEHGVAL